MSAASLLAQLQDLGAKVSVAGDQILIDVDGELSPDLLVELRNHKGELVSLLTSVGHEAKGSAAQGRQPTSAQYRHSEQGPMTAANDSVGAWPSSGTGHHVVDALPFLAMSLGEFRERGALLEVRVPWLAATLWVVPAEHDVSALLAGGVSRGRIWTARELRALVNLGDPAPKVVKTLTHAKLEFDGDIVEVRQRRP